MAIAHKNLFDLLPEKIFRPLGANEHSRRNWDALLHLYNDFFSPESIPLDPDGWLQKRISNSLETFLIRWDDHSAPVGDDAHSPLNVRANAMMRMFIDNDWLTVDRAGFTQYISMPPTVQSFFELLNNFVEQGPEFIGGRVQSIRNNLEVVRSDPSGNAAVFQIAAKECSALLKMLNTTRMRVREASELLRGQQDGGFARNFFEGYIAELYIGDYHDLFSKNHPLTSRWEIIGLVTDVFEDEESRAHLCQWYRKHLKCKNNEDAFELFELDVHKVLALKDVDKLLSRLNNEVTRANDQALGYIEYQLRSQGSFDKFLEQTFDALSRTYRDPERDNDTLLPVGWSQNPLFTEDALRPPAARSKPPAAARIVKREMTPEAKARRLVRQIIKGNRTVSDDIILSYVDRHLAEGNATDSAHMKVESINDLCVLAAFSRIGVIAERDARNQRVRGSSRPKLSPVLAGSIRITPTGERFENEYLEAPGVRIERIKKPGKNDAS